MTKRQRKPNRLAEELKEMGEALHRLGALSDDEYEKITLRDVALDRIGRSGPPSPREIVAIRESARMSQAVFARLLVVSTGTLSKWERGEKRPDGPSLKLLNLVKSKGLQALA